MRFRLQIGTRLSQSCYCSFPCGVTELLEWGFLGLSKFQRSPFSIAFWFCAFIPFLDCEWTFSISRLLFVVQATGLRFETEYEFRVVAVNAAGEGTPSAPSHAFSARTPVEAPGEPSDLEVVDSTNTSLTLSWKGTDQQGGAELLGYEIEIKEVKYFCCCCFGVRLRPLCRLRYLPGPLFVFSLPIPADSESGHQIRRRDDSRYSIRNITSNPDLLAP